MAKSNSTHVANKSANTAALDAKALAKRREAVGLELVKVFARTPEERATKDKREADAAAAKLQQQAQAVEQYKKRSAGGQARAAASNPFCGSSADETMVTCSHVIRFLRDSLGDKDVSLTEDGALGLRWIYGALNDALDKQSKVEDNARKKRDAAGMT